MDETAMLDRVKKRGMKFGATVSFQVTLEAEVK
jgi:hypothetical protein